MTAATEPAAGAAAELAGQVLDIEAERHRLQAGASEAPLFADDLLPGVGSAAISLREGLHAAGSATFVLLMILAALDELESAALGVLAPNIRDTFHVSSGAIVFISAASGGFLVLGALPMGWLADRFRRGPIIGWAGSPSR